MGWTKEIKWDRQTGIFGAGERADGPGCPSRDFTVPSQSELEQGETEPLYQAVNMNIWASDTVIYLQRLHFPSCFHQGHYKAGSFFFN